MNSISKIIKHYRNGYGNHHEICDAFEEFIPCSIQPTYYLKGHKGCINTCSFNNFGNKLLTGCDDGSVWLWDIESRPQDPLVRVRPHISNVFTTNFLSSNTLISGGNDGTVKYIQINESTINCTSFNNHHIRKVLSSFVIDENTFVTCGYDCTIRLFDVRQPYPGTVQTVLPSLTIDDYNYDGQEMLATSLIRNHINPQSDGGGSSIPITTNPYNESLLVEVAKEEENELFSMDVYPNDRKQFICSTQGSVLWYDLRNILCADETQAIGFNVSNQDQILQCVSGVAFNKNGTLIAASVFGAGIIVFDVDKAQKIRVLRQNEDSDEQLFDLIDFVPEYEINNSHIMRSLQRAISVLSGEEEEEDFGEEAGEEEEPYSENVYFSEGTDGLSEEDVSDGVVAQLTEHSSVETIKGVNWYGDYVVTGSDDGSVFFYDVERERVVNIVKAHQSNVNVVAVHPNNLFMATSGMDQYAVLWEPMHVSKTNMNNVMQRIDELNSFRPINITDCNIY
ncbi:WD40 repeat-containing protein [Histomonas meleagridis]|uniref:WD40 repeat-containing protein n=1 Tax=Histomonas meleagridis TaxID=135588 RepID=UPI0035597AAE|nr:WD40 repeat-containing protein [Histomonas meleagridis]KAH0804906.1 WD40 repeat-containing protein [Histomonas meleagridis]